MAQQKHEAEEQEEKSLQERARALDTFDRQNHAAVPHPGSATSQPTNGGGSGFQGANSVKVTSYEEEALRNMKAFWLPSATPEAPEKVAPPPTATVCPEGKEKLKLKSLFPIKLTEANGGGYMCPSCKTTLTNTHTLVTVSVCGHVYCKRCADKFVATDGVCLACGRECKEKHLVGIQKGGTGFAGHGDNLEATSFKHLGSGSGLGLVRPAAKT